VCIGSSSDLIIYPGTALLIGVIIGVISFSGFVYGIPLLKEKAKLFDTCGVLYLHGIPGVCAALFSTVVVGQVNLKKYTQNLITQMFVNVYNHNPYHA
jgi:ammonium transporter Rh